MTILYKQKTSKRKVIIAIPDQQEKQEQLGPANRSTKPSTWPTPPHIHPIHSSQ
jgi:hypothetical protein